MTRLIYSFLGLLLRDLGLSVAMEAVLMLLKFIVPVVIFVCLSTYTGVFGDGTSDLLEVSFYWHFSLPSFPCSSQTPPSFSSHPVAGRAVCVGVAISTRPTEGQLCVEGLRHGFHLGFSPSQTLKSAKQNMPSAPQHPSVVDQYLANHDGARLPPQMGRERVSYFFQDGGFKRAKACGYIGEGIFGAGRLKPSFS